MGYIPTWLPAFGFLTDHSFTWTALEVGLALAILFAVTSELWGLAPIKRKRAVVDIFLMTSALPITFIVYAVRIFEFLTVEISYPSSICVGQLIGLISVVFAVKLFRSTIEELNGLYRLGLLRKYQILDEVEGTWTHTNFPGIDGTTPEERIQQNYQKSRWWLMLPAGGIAFYIIRTWTGSATWVLLLVHLIIYTGFLYLFSLQCAHIFQLFKWEGQFGKHLYIKEKR